MIFFTTVSSGLKFVERHPELVERFLKSLIEGIHYFKTQPERATRKLSRRVTITKGSSTPRVRARRIKCSPMRSSRKLYPSPAAIANVYLEGIRQDKDAAKMQPMELWDLHFLRKLEDTGFMSGLYSS